MPDVATTDLPYVILPLIGALCTSFYYQLENNEGMPEFKYFKGELFLEVLFPLYIFFYLLGKQSALSVYFSFDQFLTIMQFFAIREKLKTFDKVDVEGIKKQEYARIKFIR